MIKKMLAALVAVAMVSLSVTPVAEAQGRRRPRPYIYGYSGTPLEAVMHRNQGMVDGLFNELPWGLGSDRGFRGPYFPGPSYGYGFGNDPYYYGGYDYYYDDGGYGWRYRRHNTRENLQTIGTIGALVLGGIALSKAGKADKKAEAASAPVPVLREAPEPQSSCVATRVVNLTRSPAFVGELGGRGLFVEPGQTVESCLAPADCAYLHNGENLVPANVVLQGDTAVIR